MKFDQVDLVYGLDDKPAPGIALMVGMQHLMGMVVGIVLPSVLISDALGLPVAMKIHLIQIALFVSGIGTILQVRWGSGLLTMQGTSFIFVGALIGVGVAAREQGADAAGMLAAMSGVALMGSLVQIGLSRMARVLKKIFPPLVSGVTVTLVGLSLVEMAMRDACGGMAAVGNNFGGVEHLGVATLVLVSILVFQRVSIPLVRACAVLLGLLLGCLAAWPLGWMHGFDLTLTGALPLPLSYGISFSWQGLASFALLYVLSTVEVVGDVAASSMVSKRPVEGEEFLGRLRRGICVDGIASALAALFNSFPMAIFALNNGVIQLTGVASRRVGYYVGVILILAGLFPVVGSFFSFIPPSVMGGAMLLVFGSVAAAGVKIISTAHLDRRGMTIVGLGLGVGLGVAFVPELSATLPGALGQITSSAVAAGGLTAIIAQLALPNSSIQVATEH